MLKTRLKLDENNEIQGYLTLEGPFSILPIEDIGFLTNMGFQPDEDDIVSIQINIKGRRYLARNLGQNLLQSKSIYYIPISYNDSTAAQDLSKAAITPIAVGLDAVLLIGKIIVYPLSRKIQ